MEKQVQANRVRIAWHILSLVALFLSLFALALHANQFWIDRKREALYYTTSYHFKDVFVRFKSDWNRKLLLDGEVLELTSPDGDIKFLLGVFDGHESPLEMSEAELMSAASDYLASFSERAVRSNNAHRWPLYLAARTKKVDGRYFAQYRIVIFLPGLEVWIEASTPNKILEHDPTASNPFGKNAFIVGAFVDAITKIEEIPQSQELDSLH